MTKQVVGWIGTGRMGLPMAERLRSAGHPLRVWNRTAAKIGALMSGGVQPATRPADLSTCEVVFSMLSGHQDLQAVLFGTGGLLSDVTAERSVRVVVDCSSISAEQSRLTRDRLAAFDVSLLAAPVSGNPVAVADGSLSIICSGPRPAFDRCLPYLTAIAPTRVTYAGKGESARVAKLCHNVFLSVAMQSLAEIVVLGEKNGLQRSALLDFLNHSVLGSTFTRYKTRSLVSLEFTATFTPELMLKDVDLALDMARRQSVPLLLASVTRQLYQSLIGNGYGSQDIAASLLLQARASGLVLERPES